MFSPIDWPQLACKEFGHFWGFQWVITLTIEALEFATARLPQQEAHRLAAFWA
jgi:hypothetical protein